MDSGTAARAGTSASRISMLKPTGTGAASSAPIAPRLPEKDLNSSNARQYEGGRLVWRVPSGDLINRERSLVVFVEKNQVMLISPPGETARLTQDQLAQLRTALDEAAKMAER